MSQRDWTTPYKNLLYVVTGAIPYYVLGGLPFALLMNKICPAPIPSSPCGIFVIALIAFAIIGAPIAVSEWHRTGKWFWTKVLHVFVEA